jgi:hypothetical protein
LVEIVKDRATLQHPRCLRLPGLGTSRRPLVSDPIIRLSRGPRLMSLILEQPANVAQPLATRSTSSHSPLRPGVRGVPVTILFFGPCCSREARSFWAWRVVVIQADIVLCNLPYGHALHPFQPLPIGIEHQKKQTLCKLLTGS